MVTIIKKLTSDGWWWHKGWGWVVGMSSSSLDNGGAREWSTMLGGGETLELGGRRHQAGERGRTHRAWSSPLGFSPPCVIVIMAPYWCRDDNRRGGWSPPLLSWS